MRDEQFEGWLEAMDPRLARFEDFLMPTSWTKGFTRDSLEELEEYMLLRWPDRDSFDAEGDADWVDGAMRYIGEAYLRIAGGGWHLDNEPDVVFRGEPVIRPDTVTGFPISPYNFMGVLLDRRTGHELAKVYDGLLRQVQRRRDVEGPDWEPVRLPIPGYYGEQDPGDSPERDAWVELVEERIAALRAHAGQDGAQLDLSPQSLTVLEHLAQADLTAADIDVRSAEGAEVVARYASYLGAVLLKQAPGRWILRPGEVGTDPFVGRPFVKRLDENGIWRAGLVHSAVERLADEPDPGLFAGVLHAYAG